ncbi:hypothetical protein GGG87_03700 [Streptococcus sp. zg-86]|uniref:Uncharacterized protein n=1 Tax=Streptococcus zhangguiae TaxID=2664091 RepID=A0A6I4RF24_9STRE|nr:MULTISPECIES: hypothetical protein [unclassified Streptococcus]MTB64106.1 hypothetical protein [Streptococcus sp. zg-86]MTB90568.1 hypothetical protein [Streptococcus sp. zg-36]MWV56094.1 hypothetical protein [Streptococcus sp. zg-70]QTH48277.1 hypothetical protein J5M87_02820 [Streptococcus sp. zg-86]
MTQDELIELMHDDMPIGVKEFILLRDEAIRCIFSLKLGYRHEQMDYLTEYIRFLEDYFMEDL